MKNSTQYRHLSTLCLLVLFLLGCGDSTATHPNASVRDSAGIEIVENGEVSNLSLNAWQLSREPILQVGTAAGPPESEFHRIRAGKILPQGRLAVVNGGSQEVRFFSADGQYLGAQGNQGEGPGEYRGLEKIWMIRGDSVVVWDQILSRASVLTAEGELVRTVSLHGEVFSPRIGGVFDDGTFLVADARFTPEEATGDWQQLLVIYQYYSPDGKPMDSLGEFPWRRMKFLVASDTRAEAMSLGFDGETQVAASAQRAWIGTTKGYEVQEYAQRGTLTRIIRWIGPDRTVTDAHLDLLLEERLAGASSEEVRQRIRTAHELRDYSDLFPAYSQLLVDDQNRLWVEEYRRPGAGAVNNWVVFDEMGIALASFSVPTDVRILDIWKDQMLAVFTDDLGIEYVRLVGIEKS